MARKSKTCSCCGSDAGKWEQWWNQDTRYGICERCLEQHYSTATDVSLTFGKPGIHRPYLAREL